MSDVNNIVQASNGTCSTTSTWWPLQWIRPASDSVLKLCQNFIQSSGLAKRGVEVVGEYVKPFADFMLKPSLNKAVKTTVQEITKRNAADLQNAIFNIVISEIEASADVDPKSMLDVNQSYVTAALYLLQHTDSCGNFIQDHKYITKVGAAVAKTCLDLVFGLVTGTLSKVAVESVIGCAQSILATAMQGFKFPVEVQNFINFILKTVEDRGVTKQLVKAAASCVSAFCKLITAPTTSMPDITPASSANIPTDCSKSNVVIQSSGQAYEAVRKQ